MVDLLEEGADDGAIGNGTTATVAIILTLCTPTIQGPILQAILVVQEVALVGEDLVVVRAEASAAAVVVEEPAEASSNIP